MTSIETQSFYIVAREPGAEHPALPTWANDGLNPVGLATQYPVERIVRQELVDVPGAYQLLNVLSAEECQQFVAVSEAQGYLEDAAVSLPRNIRHNDSLTWVTDAKTDELIWQRVAPLAGQQLDIFEGKMPLGLNARFRFYRYAEGDYFSFHTDGAWPGSRVVNSELIRNAYSDRFSQMTFLIFLNDDFSGGATRFIVTDASGIEREVDIRTPQGGVLCFPHGMHPLHCVHSSEPIFSGTKYIIRTDMLFEL